jgi:hypothetical protein
MKSNGVLICLAISLFPKPSFGQQDIVASVRTLNARANRVSPMPAPQPILKIAIYSFGQFDSSVLLGAEKVAAEIFKQSHIQVDWLNCPSAQFCDRLAKAIRIMIHSQIGEIVKDPAQATLMIEHDSLGFAIPCAVSDTVCLAYIFSSPINRLALAEGTSVAVILGHVIAHEIGHALLGSNAHARTGIMQGKLPIAELERFLYFRSGESKHLAASLVARNQH